MFNRAQCFQHTEIWPDGRVSLFGRAHGGASTVRGTPYPVSASRPRRVHFSSTTPETTTSVLRPTPSAVVASSHPNPAHTRSQNEEGANAGNNGGDGPMNVVALTDEVDDGEWRTRPSDNNNLIKKPKGECGRPGTGGYNLEKKLNWTEARFEEVKGFVRDHVLKSLDCHLSFTKQPQDKINKIKQKALTKFPFLSQYKNLWPVDDLILGVVKYRNSAMKKAKAVAALKAVDEAINAVAGDDAGGRQTPNTRSKAKGVGN
ncbi:hypothetical protein PQX77_012043 [Marasmius sp. AFHP31]|nr:hypothetical protein PQX77_012043 [Marasmius sp. AFHP31]